MSKLKCIMLVDDDEATNFLNKLIISEAVNDVHIRGLQTAYAALDSLRKREICEKSGHFIIPDLILLDLNMPGVNGWEFLEEFKQLDNDITAKTKIIILTSSINPEDIEKSRKITELSGYLSKPLTESMVIKIVEEHFK